MQPLNGDDIQIAATFLAMACYAMITKAVLLLPTAAVAPACSMPGNQLRAPQPYTFAGLAWPER